jgi:glycosyltransferase involved in cell wall biosynthesis
VYAKNRLSKEFWPETTAASSNDANQVAPERAYQLSASHNLQNAKTVAILLCTYHGQRFLVDQLESFAAQAYPHWAVWASDDGSKDGTHAILEEYRAKWVTERLSIHSGPAEGFVANFLSLTCNASIQADYYAYADQDDVWENDKLSRAVKWLDTIPKEVPALYCSRTRIVDAENQHLGFSPLFSKPPSFANALVQSIGGGNTMVFNDAARRLLQETDADVGVVSHDWWAYMVVSGCGGKVCYDPHPTIRYRQHGQNLVGCNNDWRARLVRLTWLLKGRFRDWSEQNVNALQQIRRRLTPENRLILDEFASARHRGLARRIVGFKRSNIYRQTLLGNLGLFAAALLKKI